MTSKRGRPQKEIDKAQFEKLCELQCTLIEILCFFGVSDKTLESWCKREYGLNFSEVFQEKRRGGLISLRRMQFQLARKSAAMAIFLGKNYLGQTDKDYWQRAQEEKALQLKEKVIERDDF